MTVTGDPIANLSKKQDAFTQSGEQGNKHAVCHIRIQQRGGRKVITTVQGIPQDGNNPDNNYDLKKIAKYLKKMHNCNGTIIDHSEYGEVIQLTGDQRQNVKDFIVRVGIMKVENVAMHGF